ncbi:MAG: serine/threonine protein kinase [Methanospirillum sp.]|nr:serine/threonine protein kinase [Methanospirillum sp.]
MKTTILTETPAGERQKSAGNLPLLLINLFLAINYLIMLGSLASAPVKHGHGGIGDSFSLPSVFILFFVLIIVHLVLLFQPYLSGQILIISGFIQIIAGAMILGLLLFSHKELDLLHNVYPVPLVGFGLILLSILLGLHRVTKGMIPGVTGTADALRHPLVFPFPDGRYRNVRVITEGGVGTIWYAERVADDIPVVVKVPSRGDEKIGLSFMQEISLWRDLEHPHIATVLSANILPIPYIEIEYLPGGSLAGMKKPISVPRAVEMIKDLVSALTYAHGKGVAHCDIKPSNILLTREGAPKLTDWGLARSGSSRWSVSGFSPRYAAPEQHHRNPGCGFATDIWQIGMVFTELITGTAGIPSGDEPVFLREEGAAVLPVVYRCLATDPGDRYPSALALREDLDRCFPL